MTTPPQIFTKIKFGDGLGVTDEGDGVIRVDGDGGSGGGGIQFDTYPQNGGMLYLHTGSERIVSNSYASMIIETDSREGTEDLEWYWDELVIQSLGGGQLLIHNQDGRIYLMARTSEQPAGDPRPEAVISLWANPVGWFPPEQAGGSIGMDASVMSFNATGNGDSTYADMEFHLSGTAPSRGILFRLYGSGEFGICLNQAGVNSYGQQFVIYENTNNNSGVGINPIFMVKDDGTVHIRSGHTIIADL